MPVMQRVREGELPYSKIDELHRLILDGLIKDFGLKSLSLSDVDNLNRVWHRLMPWPDSVPGLNRLRGRFVVASLSNGNVSLLVNMAKNAGIPWDCVLSAELTGHYKPDKEVYIKAADLLGLEPNEIMMVAAHPIDLRAAAGVGYRTALVLRPLERGPDRGLDFKPDPSEFDLLVENFWDLARQLGA
jgi:2-haloacid dehalogenase